MYYVLPLIKSKSRQLPSNVPRRFSKQWAHTVQTQWVGVEYSPAAKCRGKLKYSDLCSNPFQPEEKSCGKNLKGVLLAPSVQQSEGLISRVWCELSLHIHAANNGKQAGRRLVQSNNTGIVAAERTRVPPCTTGKPDPLACRGRQL